MRPAPRGWRRLRLLLAFVTVAGIVPLAGTVRAAAPVVTITPTGARVQVSSATLAETIDALARVAGFKVTYDGARPSAMLFNAEVDTPTVAHTLSRLLEGQNLNYGIVFDLTGTKVTALMIFGTASKTPGSAGGGGSTPARPQPFTTPRNPRATMPPVDDDPVEEVQADTTPEPTPTPTPSPVAPQQGTPPNMPSPFAPRPFGRPLVPPPTPPPAAPTPSPLS